MEFYFTSSFVDLEPEEEPQQREPGRHVENPCRLCLTSVEVPPLQSFRTYSPPSVDRTWGIWGSYHNIPKAIFYLLKGDYIPL